MINEKCPGVAINTEEYTTYGFRNCLGCILKNSFSFNGPIISELGKEISTADVYAEYWEEREKVTLDDLKKISSDMNTSIIYWESVREKTIRLSQLSKYFGVDEKYFLNISEEDKEYIVSKALYRRQDNEKEVYCFIKQGEMKDDFKYRSFSYPNFEESLDEQMIHAKKKETMEGILEEMGYFGKPDKIVEDVSAINRGCKVYDALTKYLRQMPNEKPGTTILYYNMARNVLFSLLIANGLMSKEELEKEFEHNIGSKLYDDIEWIYEQADIFKNRYDYKLRLVEEENIKFREKMKKLHDKE